MYPDEQYVEEGKQAALLKKPITANPYTYIAAKYWLKGYKLGLAILEMEQRSVGED